MYILIAVWVATSMGNARSEDWQELSMQEFGTQKACIEAKNYIKALRKDGVGGIEVVCVPKYVR